MPRKIVQVAVTTQVDFQYYNLYALCDDGSLWSYDPFTPAKIWSPIEPIPQPEGTPDAA